MFGRIKHHVGNFLPALRSPNYRLYFVGQGISLIGTWMATVAEQWLIYPTLTNNKSLLGIVSAINLLPITIFVLFAGVMADRVDRRRAQIVLQLFFTVIAFAMSGLVATGYIQVWHVMVAAAVSGIVFAFDMPTRQSLMVNLVDRAHMASALSLNGAIFNSARAIGPVVAGIIIAAAGIAPAYFFNGVSFIAVIGCLLLMRLPKHEPKDLPPPFFSQLKDGFQFVRTTPMVITPLFLTAVFTFFTWPQNTLLAVFAHDIYQKGEVGFGILQSVFGVGAMIGGFGFSFLYDRIKRKDRLLLFALTTLVVTMASFAFNKVFVVAIPILIVNGWSVTTIIGILNTTIQSHTPDVLRGRIMSYYSFVLVGSMPFGAILASLGVSIFGAPLTIFFCMTAFLFISLFLLIATKGQFLSRLALET